MLVDWVEQHELTMEQHQHGGLTACADVHAFDFSHGMEWREIKLVSY